MTIKEMSNWRPIETAPQNEVVDLFVPWPPNSAGFKGFRYTNCYLRPDGKWTSKHFDSEQRRTVNNPSHWMPLPEPPNVKAEHAVCAWVPVSERMPAPNESQSGYFWCWGPEYDPPELLAVSGYESWELPGTGFCNSDGTATSGNVTHWQPANPPDTPPTKGIP